jgi:hypothetical protein
MHHVFMLTVGVLELCHLICMTAYHGRLYICCHSIDYRRCMWPISHHRKEPEQGQEKVQVSERESGQESGVESGQEMEPVLATGQEQGKVSERESGLESGQETEALV